MMDTAMAARAVGGSVVGAAVHFSRVTTDTRALAPGDLFVALKGERFDGHDFVPRALANFAGQDGSFFYVGRPGEAARM